MTDYKKLVKALRCCDEYALCNDCPIFKTCDGYVDKAMAIAADAIEALQPELIRICKQLPKRGEWVRVREVDIPGEMHPVAYRCMCSMCRNEYVFPRIPQYCPDCGSRNTAKMEVQE